MIFRWCVAGERNGAIFSSSLEKPKSGTKQDEKSFPSSIPHSVQYTYHYDEKYTHPAACTLLFIFDNISFLQQCPAPFFIIFSSTKSTTMLNELKGNSSTATLQRFSLLSPSSLLSKYQDENLMIMVGR